MHSIQFYILQAIHMASVGFNGFIAIVSVEAQPAMSAQMFGVIHPLIHPATLHGIH
jgi:hypothetical protein